MTWEIALVLADIVLVTVALIFLRTGPDLVLMAGLTVLVVAGVIEPTAAISGFANPGLIAVALLFVVAEGLRQTGAAGFVAGMLGKPQALRSAQTRLMLPTAFFSAFLNNTPVVAMMMPVVSDWAKKLRLSVSHLLLPLSYAAILGGMCTLIGTSTTLVVDGMLAEHTNGAVRLSMFELAWVGVPASVLGGLYLLFASKSLLPQRKPAFDTFDNPREYTVEMLVEPGSPLVGKTIESAGLRHLPGAYLMEVDREGQVIAAVGPQEILQANDRLVFVGVVESVVDLQKMAGLTPAADQVFKLDTRRSERSLIEAVVSNTFPTLRQTIRESRFRSRYNAVVVAVARNGERIRGKIGDIVLQPGDTLLLEAHPSFIDSQRNRRDFFLVSLVKDSEPPRHERVWIARAILLAMVVLVAAGVLTMVAAAMAAAALMIATRCCRGEQARQAIDLSVLITIGAGLGLGKAMAESGAAAFVAGGFITLAGDNPYATLAILSALTLVFTNLITAKAAVGVVFPVAVAAAANLQCDLVPFAVAVAISAAASFATPIGYQTNLMVYGPGGYRPSDYLRLGGPLSLIVLALVCAIVPMVWQLSG